MSDSDDDLIPDIHSEINGMHTQRPNKNTYITGFSTRNNTMLTSTFNKQNLFNERHNYNGKFDQRSMCFRRETSPMSLRSFPDSRMQNRYNSSYSRGLSSQRSVLNGRSRSPMSMRSIDSNATVSAADIALAFKNENFNKYELKLIKEAYTKFMKNRIRKRIEKRRNLKLFLKSTRREFGDDSGDHGSDSSISSDDCRSTRTATYKENLPQYRQRPLKINTSTIRNTINKTDMYEDCTENIKQKSFKNMLAIKEKINTSLSPNRNISIQQNKPQLTLKDQFAKRNAIKLPSERFNKPGLKTNHSEGTQNTCNASTYDTITRNNGFESNSENEEIFSEVTVRENAQKSTVLARKRNLVGEDPNNMNTKRKKLSTSPIKYKNESLVSSTLINTHNEFIFKKPQMPMRKSVREKNTIFTDKLISKSAQPLDDDDFDPDFNLTNKDKNPNNASQQNITEIVNVNNETEKSQNNTEVSLNPSFIKRKLFSQQFDFKDNKNQSIKNVDLNSPQTKLHAGENCKARKVVTSQTCLNREILEEENVLDLINKIVPIEQMNKTNATHKEDKTKSQDEDQWDVTSVISMCNNDDISETFTDEEIFKTLQNKNENKSQKDTNKVNNAKSKKDRDITENKTTNRNTEAKINESKKDTKAKIEESQKTAKVTQCAIVLDKLDLSNTKAICDQIKTIQSQNKKTVSSCVRSFWDTDFESDVEERPHFTLSNKIMNDKDHQNYSVVNNTLNFNKRNGIKGTILNVRNSQSVGVNISIRPDRNRNSQRKNLDRIHKASVDTEKCNKNCKAHLTSSVTEEKRKVGRPKHNDTNSLTPARKGSKKETCYKQKATDVNNVKKNGTINKTRILTPRKVNENKRQSSPKNSDSSFNCSNLSIRLRIRKKKIDYKSM